MRSLAAACWFDWGIAVFDRLLLTDERRWLAARVSGRVLELGTGTGHNLTLLPPGSRVVGVDLDLDRLCHARRRCANMNRFVPLRADMARLPFGDASFDTVVSTFTFCEVADPGAALSEAGRVLRPGGRLLMVEHVAADTRIVRAAQRMLESVTVPVWEEHFTRRPLVELPRHGFTVHEHRSRVGGIIERIHASR